MIFRHSHLGFLVPLSGRMGVRMKFDNCIYKGELKSVYYEDGKAIKVFAPNYSKTDVLYEALNTARVEDAGMDIPKLLDVSFENGQWSITSEFIEGKTLSTLMKENPSNIDNYIEQMVDLQLEINQKQNPFLNKLKDKLSFQINSLDTINDSTKYELRTLLESMPKHTKLCHGDFNPDNIIVTESGKLYVIDWVHATQGNASADVARTYLLLAINSLENADNYMNCFCKKSATNKKYVEQWIPIVAAAQLCKNKPEEKELLLKWTDISDFS